jgi:hypothetical protein
VAIARPIASKHSRALRSSAPRAVEAKQLRQPIRHAAPVGVFGREPAKIYRALLRSQA